MASAPSTYTQFMRLTGPSYLTGTEDIVNEAVKQTYLLGRMLRNADPSKTIQGGADIRDEVLFDEQSTYQNYHPNEVLTPTNPQTGASWVAQWRYGVDHMSWTDQEILRQVPKGLTQTARHQVYKNLKYAKEQRMWTSMLNGMENALWAVPETADMEATDGKKPYSIPALVNEWGNGLFYSRTGGTATGKTAWTTKQSINPTTETKWAPANQGQALAAAGYGTFAFNTGIRYDNLAEPNWISYLAGATKQTLLQAFDRAWAICKFIPPPTKQEYFENPTLSKQVICASIHGEARYKAHLRSSQDSFANYSDPSVNMPAYAGIDVLRISSLDTAALYPDDSPANAPVSEMASTAEDIGPRFYMLNLNYLTPVFHAERYMEKTEPLRHRDQPYTWVQYCDIWYQIVGRSLQRHAIIGPTADMTAV